jgi:hypothetical protein
VLRPYGALLPLLPYLVRVGTAALLTAAYAAAAANRRRRRSGSGAQAHTKPTSGTVTNGVMSGHNRPYRPYHGLFTSLTLPLRSLAAYAVVAVLRGAVYGAHTLLQARAASRSDLLLPLAHPWSLQPSTSPLP